MLAHFSDRWAPWSYKTPGDLVAWSTLVFSCRGCKSWVFISKNSVVQCRWCMTGPSKSTGAEGFREWIFPSLAMGTQVPLQGISELPWLVPSLDAVSVWATCDRSSSCFSSFFRAGESLLGALLAVLLVTRGRYERDILGIRLRTERSDAIQWCEQNGKFAMRLARQA